MTPLLYTAELDLEEADVAPFLDWYAFRHAPDVYEVGLLSCTCYRVFGTDMNLFDLYELPDWSLFETARYRGMRGRDPYMDRLMEKRRNKAHTIYDQRLIAPPAEAPSLRADWISVLRFAAPPEKDGAVCDALQGLAGAGRVRYATRGKDHPRNPTFRPRCMVVTEWASRPAIDLLALVRGVGVSEPDAFIGHRVYPWPDTPA
jgi:hypothetical protein